MVQLSVRKEWFLLIKGKKQGPFSLVDLCSHPLVTPDTLVWKEGFPSWIPIRHVPELKVIFQDEVEETPQDESKEQKPLLNTQDTTLAIRYEPPQFYFFILIVILMICYTLYQLYIIH